MNSAPWSDVTWEGTLCFVNMCKMNKEASLEESSVLKVGMNTACLVSLSMTTRMSEQPLDSGSCSMKSIEIEFQGQEGTGSCLSRP